MASEFDDMRIWEESAAERGTRIEALASVLLRLQKDWSNPRRIFVDLDTDEGTASAEISFDREYITYSSCQHDDVYNYSFLFTSNRLSPFNYDELVVDEDLPESSEEEFEIVLKRERTTPCLFSFKGSGMYRCGLSSISEDDIPLAERLLECAIKKTLNR